MTHRELGFLLHAHHLIRCFFALCGTLLALICGSIYAQAKPNQPSTTEGLASEKSAKEGAKMATGDGKETSKTAPTVPDIKAQQNRLLKQALTDRGIIELGGAKTPFLGLWEPDITGNPYGAVLLLPTEGHNVDWPQSTQALRTGLTEYGWSTLSINVPPSVQTKVPKRPLPVPPKNGDDQDPAQKNVTADGENTSSDMTAAKTKEGKAAQAEASSDITAPSMEADAQNRLATAISFLNDKGQFNIVIVAHGNSAPRIARHIDANSSAPSRAPQTDKDTKAIIQGPVRALILVNARNTVKGQKQNLVALLKDPALPVLDIYSGQHYLDEYESQQRLQAARKKQFKHYFQLQIMPSTKDTNVFDSTLVKRIRGFLTAHAKGVEIEGKK